MDVKNGFVDDCKYKRKRHNKWMNIAAQVIATTAFGCLILSVSAICAMPTIVLAKNPGTDYNTSVSETGIFPSNSTKTPDNSTHNVETYSYYDRIPMTDGQMSWFGSIVFFVQPFGSICSGFIQETFGRKKCMAGVTIPQLAGWIIMAFATNVGTLFFAAIMMGLSIGFMEAPAMSFLGEVTEPRYRGVLAVFSEVFLLLGTSFDYLVAGLLSWRSACLTASAIPILAFLSIIIVPESPTWLLSKGRYGEALDALCWLRGWVHPDVVRQEYVDLIQHLKLPNGPESTPLKDSQPSLPVAHGIRQGEKKPARLMLLLERRVYEPLFLVVFLFIVGHCTSLLGMRPTFHEEYKVGFGGEISQETFFIAMSCTLLIGSLAGAATIRLIGKRGLIFISLGISTVCCFLLSLYAIFNPGLNWMPNILFIIIGFCSGLGVLPIPWILTCEVFPQDARGVAAGLAAACSYLFAGIVIVSYKKVAEVLSIKFTVLVYSIFGLVGLIYMYYMLPETEGKTLAEIELYFNKQRAKTSQERSSLREKYKM